MRVCTGFIWLGVGSNCRLLWTRKWIFGFHERWIISWPAARLSARRELSFKVLMLCGLVFTRVLYVLLSTFLIWTPCLYQGISQIVKFLFIFFSHRVSFRSKCSWRPLSCCARDQICHSYKTVDKILFLLMLAQELSPKWLGCSTVHLSAGFPVSCFPCLLQVSRSSLLCYMVPVTTE